MLLKYQGSLNISGDKVYEGVLRRRWRLGFEVTAPEGLRASNERVMGVAWVIRVISIMKGIKLLELPQPLCNGSTQLAGSEEQRIK